MLSFKSISYEEMRLEYFRKQRDSAERRMNYWCSAKQADRVGWMEASDRASEAGAQYNFYNDALEALEAGKDINVPTSQFKWISVEERLPGESVTVLVYRDGCCGVARLLDVEPEIMWTYTGFGGDPTHWMPLPSTEGIK